MTTNILLAALLSSVAASSSAAPLMRTVPLPGYGAGEARPLLAAGRDDAPFPAVESLLKADPLESLVAADEDLRDSLSSGDPADSLRKGLREASVEGRLDAVRAAAYPRNVSADPLLAGVMLRLDQPAKLRAAAALAMGRIGDRIAVGSLSEALKDPAPEVRYAAALSLGRLPADGVATRLEHVLLSDPVWQARYAAAIALGRTRKSFAASALEDALSSDPAWQVRQQAARSLQDLGTVHAAAALQGALNDPEPSVRAAAGVSLAAIGSPAQRRAVADAVDGEPDPTVRSVLASAARRSRVSAD
jgi:HEAT repeat protein